MNRFLFLLRSPKDLFLVFYWNVVVLGFVLTRKKVLFFNFHHDYILQNNLEWLHRVAESGKVIVYMCYDKKDKLLEKVVSENFEEKQTIDKKVSPFVFCHLFIAAEISGPDFPFKLIPSKKLQVFHGLGFDFSENQLKVILRFNHLFLSNPKMQALRQCIPEKSSMHAAGYPKLDYIIKNNSPLSQVKTIGIYPHWNEEGFVWNLGWKQIVAACVKMAPQRIILKVHRYLQTRDGGKELIAQMYHEANRYECVIVDEHPSSNQLMEKCDMLISDINSSSVLEFLLLGKRCLSYSLKMSDTADYVNFLRKKTPVFADIIEFEQELDRLVNGKHVDFQKLSEEAQKLYLFYPGCASQRYCDLIKNKLLQIDI